MGFTGLTGACLWNGTPESIVALHSPAYTRSYARATDGTTQVGEVYLSLDVSRAVLWHGTAQSMVTLHPAAAQYSAATSLSGSQQGGWVRIPQANGAPYKAAIWSGSAESMVIMHPGPDFVESQILGMAPGQQVGWVREQGSDDHAALWNGTPESFIDLDPLNGGPSRLLATCGTAQVGWCGVPGQGIVAAIWFGTPESFIPLGTLIPPEWQAFQSTATSVTEHNGMIYVGGYADTPDGARAFLWVGPVPAPGAAVVLCLAGVLGCRRKRV